MHGHHRGSIRERRAAEMRATLAAYESSRESQAAFCARRGIPLSTFTYWRRRLGTQPAAPAASRFLEVEVTEPTGAADIELHLPGGVRAVIGSGATEATIRKLLSAARSSC